MGKKITQGDSKLTIHLYSYILMYIRRFAMMCAKVFTSGNSQAVRIPKEFHIDFPELLIKKIGSSIILSPKESNWENLKNSLDEFTDDFMSSGSNQPSMQNRELF